MFSTEVLVPLWTDESSPLALAETPDRPVLIVLEALGVVLHGQMLELSPTFARVLPQEPFLMCGDVRVRLRFRFKDVVYSLLGRTQGGDRQAGFGVDVTSVSRQDVAISAGAVETSLPAGLTDNFEDNENKPKRSKEAQRKVLHQGAPNGRERRMCTRHEIEAMASLVVLDQGRILKCLVLELSLSGCRLFGESPIHLEQDTPVEVEFTGRGYPLRLRACVKIKSDEYVIGLEFTYASERVIESLNDLIGELESDLRVD
jgi:hypothetical protein